MDDEAGPHALPDAAPPFPAPDDAGVATRRRLLGLGAAVAAGAWVAPAVLGTDIAGAQATPPGGDGFIAGITLGCQGPFEPFVDVEATGPDPQTTLYTTTSDANGNYSIGPVPPGLYTVGIPFDPFPVQLLVLQGLTTTQDIFPGC